MIKLSRKDDLTLVEFLMSCQSSGETAEYISAYLGKSPEVASFTAEFIRRKAAQLSGGKSVSGRAQSMLLPCIWCYLCMALGVPPNMILDLSNLVHCGMSGLCLIRQCCIRQHAFKCCTGIVIVFSSLTPS